jgi:hypothetical protein
MNSAVPRQRLQCRRPKGSTTCASSQQRNERRRLDATPFKLQRGQMADFTRAQNQLYRASVVQQGDPASMVSRVAGKQAAGVLTTAALAGFGVHKLGDAVNLSQYGTLYSDISKLTGGASAALLPVPLPDFDFSGFAEAEVRRVTDNAGHIGEIVIAYRKPKTEAGEQAALAQAIAAAAGVGTTPQEVETARAADYAQRLSIWAKCQATPGCVEQ